jgi:hypothetical protein
MDEGNRHEQTLNWQNDERAIVPESTERLGSGGAGSSSKTGTRGETTMLKLQEQHAMDRCFDLS